MLVMLGCVGWVGLVMLVETCSPTGCVSKEMDKFGSVCICICKYIFKDI